jgi:hypothetical protein
LQQWRQKFEAVLDARPRLQPLALLSHYLTEFQYNKIDEIEIPGQYTEVRPHAPDFIFVIDDASGQGLASVFYHNSKVFSQVRNVSFQWVVLETYHAPRQ